MLDLEAVDHILVAVDTVHWGNPTVLHMDSVVLAVAAVVLEDIHLGIETTVLLIPGYSVMDNWTAYSVKDNLTVVMQCRVLVCLCSSAMQQSRPTVTLSTVLAVLVLVFAVKRTELIVHRQ